LVLCFSTVLAQQNDTCSAFVEQALAAVDDACASTGRNEACYGNFDLEAVPRESAVEFTFAEQGDRVSVADLDSLRLRQLDVENSVWGVALMQIQANLPDSLPGQNVTFLLFGDVEIRNEVEPTPDRPSLELVSNGGINVRATPSTTANVIGSLRSGESATATGRNQDSTWLRIQIPDSVDFGWVFAELVTPADDVESLSVVDPSEKASPFTPMQAFSIESGIASLNCSEAPADGILIQTPDGVGKIELRANDVSFQLGSTALLQAQAGDMLTFSVIEGEGEATADGVSVIIPAGAMVSVPLDDEGQAAGAPGEVVPYDQDMLANLPVDALPRAIEIADPSTTEAIEEANNPGGGTGAGAAMLPGGIDASAFTGMNSALFCSIMAQSFTDSGISIDLYLDQMRMMSGVIPAESQADFQAFIALLETC